MGDQERAKQKPKKAESEGRMNALGQEIREAVRAEFLSLLKEVNLKERRLKSFTEAAQYLNLSKRTIQDMVYKGELQCVRRDGGLPKLDVQDLDRWIEDHKE